VLTNLPEKAQFTHQNLVFLFEIFHTYQAGPAQGGLEGWRKDRGTCVPLTHGSQNQGKQKLWGFV
jgi:hypothetical protein